MSADHLTPTDEPPQHLVSIADDIFEAHTELITKYPNRTKVLPGKEGREPEEHPTSAQIRNIIDSNTDGEKYPGGTLGVIEEELFQLLMRLGSKIQVPLVERIDRATHLNDGSWNRLPFRQSFIIVFAPKKMLVQTAYNGINLQQPEMNTDQQSFVRCMESVMLNDVGKSIWSDIQAMVKARMHTSPDSWKPEEYAAGVLKIRKSIRNRSILK